MDHCNVYLSKSRPIQGQACIYSTDRRRIDIYPQLVVEKPKKSGNQILWTVGSFSVLFPSSRHLAARIPMCHSVKFALSPICQEAGEKERGADEQGADEQGRGDAVLRTPTKPNFS